MQTIAGSHRLDTILCSIRPLIDGVDWTDIREPWVGPRPPTPDGLPMIGATNVPGGSWPRPAPNNEVT
ncbi:hypothetical protein ABZX12_26645 [Kribbella sp. NPDC003505]|uniref:hypothetical protein n=1 Tax=Kribbella sp. NPDC003505 TaxID=3154448 RepID=UPI0033BDA2A0